mmetsp:Transcript_27433/g.88572  ORF Transcript_27433/g.88572 Transcript_27433/m.88572 type:complete len:210 (-) Transcript_27433:1139-1768(-)
MTDGWLACRAPGASKLKQRPSAPPPPSRHPQLPHRCLVPRARYIPVPVRCPLLSLLQSPGLPHHVTPPTVTSRPIHGPLRLLVVGLLPATRWARSPGVRNRMSGRRKSASVPHIPPMERSVCVHGQKARALPQVTIRRVSGQPRKARQADPWPRRPALPPFAPPRMTRVRLHRRRAPPREHSPPTVRRLRPHRERPQPRRRFRRASPWT